jgi:hypothetical protein
MDIPQPQTALVATTVAHQTVGALMLLAATVLAIQVRRTLPRGKTENIRSEIGVQKAVTA